MRSKNDDDDNDDDDDDDDDDCSPKQGSNSTNSVHALSHAVSPIPAMQTA